MCVIKFTKLSMECGGITVDTMVIIGLALVLVFGVINVVLSFLTDRKKPGDGSAALRLSSFAAGVSGGCAALEKAVGEARATGKELVVDSQFPVDGKAAIPGDVRLCFAGGGFIIAKGSELTVEADLSAAPKRRIFSGEGDVHGLLDKAVYPEWWGACADGHTDSSEAFQRAVNASNDIKLSAGSYVLGGVTFPQGRHMQITGNGNKSTRLFILENSTGFSYKRLEDAENFSVTFRGVSFHEKGEGQTAVGISFYGYGVHKDHNSVSVIDGGFYGLKYGVDMGYCGTCYFTRIEARQNKIVYNITRGASFLYFNDSLAVGNGRYIYADDDTPDGYSNGIDISQSSSVCAADTDIYINGWQAVFIEQSGYDLGGGDGPAPARSEAARCAFALQGQRITLAVQHIAAEKTVV